MNLKQAMQNDINKVFLNTNEHAEEHTIDGTLFTCIKTTNGSVQSSGEKLGVYVSKTLLILDQALIPDSPVVGQRLNLDGEYFYVEAVQPKAGMLYITLGANQG